MTYLEAFVSVLKWVGCAFWFVISCFGTVICFSEWLSDDEKTEESIKYPLEFAILFALALIAFIAYVVYKTQK